QGQSTTTALTTDPRFNSVNSVPFTVTPPAFSNPLTPSASFNFGIDNHLKTPYSISTSFGVQRSLPGGFQLNMDYYGRFGRRRILLGDAGQTINFVDPTSDHQSLVQAFSILEQDSRQNSGAGLPAASVAQQPFFETNMNAALSGIGQTCASFYAPFPV